MRQEVATHKPGDDAGMTAQPTNLITKRTTDKGDILRTHNTTILLVDGFAEILSPLPLTAPAREHEQTITVAEVIDILRGTPDILEADAVQVHVAYIAHLQFIGLRGIAQEDIIRPTSTSDEHGFAIEHKPTEALGGVVILDFANTEGELFIVRHLTIDDELERHVVEFWFTHVMTPPQTRILNVERLEIADTEILYLIRFEGDRSRELPTIVFATNLALHRLVGEVS